MNYEQAKRSGIMLFYPFEEKRFIKWDSSAYGDPKLDGERCRAVYSGEDNIGWQLWSSQCNEFLSVPHITMALYAQKVPISLELDGELYCHGMSFEEIHSRVSRTANLHPSYDDIKFHIFDVIDPNPQYLRIARIDFLDTHDPLIKVNHTYLESFDEVMLFFDKCCEDGYEGMILRHPAGLYVRKRSTFGMKFKPKKNDYYQIVGYKEEINKHGYKKERLGALICRGSDLTEFSVGSGLTDYQRQNLWGIREDLKGKLCHVKYQHITSGKGVPRFPIFLDIVEAGEGGAGFVPTT